MEEAGVIKRIFQNGFWISVLLHILLFLALILLVNKKAEKKELLPHHFVPAYTYSGSIQPAAIRQPSKAEKQEQKTITAETEESTESMESVDQSSSTITIPKEVKKIETRKTPIKKSLLSASFETLQETQLQEVSKKRDSEPIYLIGDDSQPADPLIKLLGRSLSAHFAYPKTAGQLGIRGKVVIGLTLHPEGYYSDIQMIQSSENPDLDAAALYAVNSAPEIHGADRFISKPKHFVIGFVFN